MLLSQLQEGWAIKYHYLLRFNGVGFPEVRGLMKLQAMLLM